MPPWLTLLLLSSLSITDIKQTTSLCCVTQILQQLNVALNSSLNIFLNFEDVSSDELELTLLETPSIQLQLTVMNFKYFRILGKFTRKALIIVNIKRHPIDPVLSHFLPHLLKELHELHIVFITEQSPIIWLKDLFVYCFGEGFVNSLLIYHRNGTTSLYSYIPYPVVRAQKISQIEEYVNRRLILRNLQHFEIRTTSFIIEPRMIHYTNRKGKHVHAGYMYNAMLEFIRRHNATLKILTKKHKRGIAHVGEQMIPSKEIDFACYPKEPNWNVSQTTALYILDSKITVPYAQPLAKHWYFAKPFTRTTWLAVLATTAYGTIMLYGSDRTQFGVHLLRIWCHLLFLPQPRIPIKNWQQYVSYFILFLSGFVLTNMYTSVLKSMLTSGLFEPQFSSLEDLQHAPFRLMITQYYADYFREEKLIPDSLIRKYYISSSEELNTNRAKLNISFMYIAYEDRLDCLLYQQHLLKVPRFKKIQESVGNGLMSFPVAPSLPYLNMLNSYLRRIFESGIFQKMIGDSCRDSIESGICHLFRTEASGRNSFNLEFYLLAVALWAIGLSIATLCFLLELVIVSNVQKKM
ncbi:hypothetical protein KR093_001391 [Drosophila rubida]|uniref:Uncharacterized protein n=1 Tax=Drosophila rubida TaxID=30044 RepID=A0AAD4JXU4_9MUSC|nr:hypothetical protein KR093_001391 [Drosophila rubida]